MSDERRKCLPGEHSRFFVLVFCSIFSHLSTLLQSRQPIFQPARLTKSFYLILRKEKKIKFRLWRCISWSSIFYREIKSNYEPENYLISVKNISFRKELTKLRISSHRLLIESGRYCSPKLPREERLCSICSESRLYRRRKTFLLDCPFYNEERNSLKI